MAMTKRKKSTVKRKAASLRKRSQANLRAMAPSMDQVTEPIEKLYGTIEKRYEDMAEHSRVRAMKLALVVIDFQKTTFDSTFSIISNVQEQSEGMVSGLLEDAAWLPKEGKDVVKEWVRLLRHGRSEFKKTVDKSFDLITGYFERMDAGDVPVKKAGAKKRGAKKATAKAPKKKTATKARTARKKKAATGAA